MSGQFGRWNFDGRALDPDYLRKVRSSIALYGPDDNRTYWTGNICLSYCALHSNKESRREIQPHMSPSGAILTWDGRLDNRDQLIREFPQALTGTSTDIEIVAAVYDRRGTNSFATLVGDWALALWEPSIRSLTLARDFAGVRPLYYSFDRDGITWSSVLDPFVLCAAESLVLNEEYVAEWLVDCPAAHLTPYVGLHAVPPSSFLSFRMGKRTITKYWDFDPSLRIHYRTDEEYEEHFRSVFAESVRRRLRSDKPVLAELSGGIDSSSIVCVADVVIARGDAETPRLDTVSYYDNGEPNWNEIPFFTKVEDRRGRTGCHIDVGMQEPGTIGNLSTRTPYTPSATGKISRAHQNFIACLKSQGSVVLISGIGGDEVTGGRPTAIPELQDFLARLRLIQLARALKAWALTERRPSWQMLFEAIQGFSPFARKGVLQHQYSPAVSWLDPGFLDRHRDVIAGLPRGVKPLGALPTFQENMFTLDTLRRQLACEPPAADPAYEKCYPYLDRSLLEFLYAIPRQQLVRPSQRRSLMRRALAGMVPSEVLNRRRKAFAVRSPLRVIATEWERLVEVSARLETGSLGIIAADLFSQNVRRARNGDEVPVLLLMRALRLESWLREINGKAFSGMRKSGPCEAFPAQDKSWDSFSAMKVS